jgi:hypothetical protein
MAPASYANIASQGANQEWTTITTKAKQKEAHVRTQDSKAKAKAKAKERRVILIQDRQRLADSNFSSFRLRNLINKAFLDKGVTTPVVALVSKTFTKNIVVTTTDAFTSDYLIEKQAIWAHLIPHQALQKDTPWYKVVVHGIPLADFDTPQGMELIKDEIRVFNKGLKPIGTPYWLTSLAKRQDPFQTAGSVAIAFATLDEAKRAISNRLYIAGISVKAEELYSTSPTSQCPTCQAFGHLENRCRGTITCAFCAENHPTRDHACSLCRTKGASCKHLVPKCSNCLGPHLATNPSCEVRKALFNTTL